MRSNRRSMQKTIQAAGKSQKQTVPENKMKIIQSITKLSLKSLQVIKSGSAEVERIAPYNSESLMLSLK